jgi:micrococcal nuclease
MTIAQNAARAAGIALTAATLALLTACSLPFDFSALADSPARPLPQVTPLAPAATEPQPIPVPANAIPATVNYVHDGDTLFLTTATDSNLKVRLTGIDTPEIGDNLECYGDEATALLRSLLPEGTAVSAAADIEPLDQYGRSLMYLFTADGTFINLEMIAQGAAEAVSIGQNTAYFDRLSAEESLADSSLVGKWGAC